MVETYNKEACFHCGLPVPENSRFYVVLDDDKQPMCCAGCQAVASAIIDNGLEQFYLHRDEKQHQAQALVPDVLKELDLYNNPVLQKSFVHQRTSGHKEASLILEGIVCAACVWLNERHVSALPGVIAFHINYATHRAQLIWNDNQIKLSDVLKSITEIGYHAHPFDPNRQEAIHKKERSLLIRQLGVAAIGMMQVMMLAIALYIGAYQSMADNITTLLRWASLVITIPVIFYSAKVFFISAFRDLKNRRLGMDVPIAIAIGAAFVASSWATISGGGEVYFDSVVMFTFFLLVGRFLEQTARHKAGDMADELVKLVPAVAHLQTNEGVKVVPVMELVVGDRVLVKAGDTIPADGFVLSGETHVNESLITGESRPVSRGVGDTLIAGSVNQDTSISIEVSHIGEDTTLASISRLLERAQAQKPHIAILANRVASWFVAALLIVAASVFGYWHFIRGSEDAFWITLSVLVVTCPCALSLATPVALTAVTGVLTKMGVLTTRGHAIETLASITDVIFDKTGTLTTGEQKLISVNTLSVDKDTALQLAGVLESQSTHPVARVFHGWSVDSSNAEIKDINGLGVEAVIDGKRYRLGSKRFIAEWVSDFPGLGRQQAGVSRVWLANEQSLLATFDIGDTLREESKAVVKQLQQRNIGVHLLSGDQTSTVKDVAEMLGIQRTQAEQMPQDKLAYLQQLQQSGAVVAMVGDGINDAPILAGADISLAMGGGTHLAQASGDMVLLSDKLEHLETAIAKTRQAMRIIRQNIAWAIAYNLIALPLAAAGLIAPWMAAIGMSFSSLIVVLNALRLKD